MGGDLVGSQAGPALGGARAQEGGLAAGAGAQVQPVLVAALERGLGQDEGGELAFAVYASSCPYLFQKPRSTN